MGPQVKPLSANPSKWSNTLKQFVGNLPTNCLSVFDHFVGLVLKALSSFHTWLTMNSRNSVYPKKAVFRHVANM